MLVIILRIQHYILSVMDLFLHFHLFSSSDLFQHVAFKKNPHNPYRKGNLLMHTYLFRLWRTNLKYRLGLDGFYFHLSSQKIFSHILGNTGQTGAAGTIL